MGALQVTDVQALEAQRPISHPLTGSIAAEALEQGIAHALACLQACLGARQYSTDESAPVTPKRTPLLPVHLGAATAAAAEAAAAVPITDDRAATGAADGCLQEAVQGKNAAHLLSAASQPAAITQGQQEQSALPGPLSARAQIATFTSSPDSRPGAEREKLTAVHGSGGKSSTGKALTAGDTAAGDTPSKVRTPHARGTTALGKRRSILGNIGNLLKMTGKENVA